MHNVRVCVIQHLYSAYLCILFQEKLEDTYWVIRIRRSKQDRQHSGKQKDKRTSNDLQNTTEETKDRGTRIPLTTGDSLGVPEGSAVPAPLVTPTYIIVCTQNVKLNEHRHKCPCHTKLERMKVFSSCVLRKQDTTCFAW